MRPGTWTLFSKFPSWHLFSVYLYGCVLILYLTSSQQLCSWIERFVFLNGNGWLFIKMTILIFILMFHFQKRWYLGRPFAFWVLLADGRSWSVKNTTKYWGCGRNLERINQSCIWCYQISFPWGRNSSTSWSQVCHSMNEFSSVISVISSENHFYLDCFDYCDL